VPFLALGAAVGLRVTRPAIVPALRSLWWILAVIQAMARTEEYVASFVVEADEEGLDSDPPLWVLAVLALINSPYSQSPSSIQRVVVIEVPSADAFMIAARTYFAELVSLIEWRCVEHQHDRAHKTHTLQTLLFSFDPNSFRISITLCLECPTNGLLPLRGPPCRFMSSKMRMPMLDYLQFLSDMSVVWTTGSELDRALEGLSKREKRIIDGPIFLTEADGVSYLQALPPECERREYKASQDPMKPARPKRIIEHVREYLIQMFNAPREKSVLVVGATDSLLIEGILFDRDDVDTLGTSLERLAQGVFPPLPPGSIRVEFVPVLNYPPRYERCNELPPCRAAIQEFGDSILLTLHCNQQNALP